MLPDLYLIRHGQSEWNAAGRMQGRLDSPLTALGRAQAAALAPLISGVDAARIASPAGRAQETARILWGDLSFASDDRLTEIDIGEFSGRTRMELETQYPDAFTPSRLGWYDRCPGGEGFAGLHTRCADFLGTLDGPAIVVTHGITLRMLRLLAMGREMAEFEGLRVEQGAVHVIENARHRVLRP